MILARTEKYDIVQERSPSGLSILRVVRHKQRKKEPEEPCQP
jgi:hypothetical protein